MYLEFMYGHSKNRWIDYEREYKLREHSLRRVFDSKLNIALEARRRWPKYASYAEDVKLRKDKWDKHFPPEFGTRGVMHDNTNIPLPTPSDADLNRALFSKYYGEPVGKGGVGIQFAVGLLLFILLQERFPTHPILL